MLIIARKSGESVRIGEDIVISVIEAGKNKVRLGIDAPKDVKIIRSELFESREFNVQAAVNKASVDFMNSFFAETPNKLNEIKSN